MTSVLVFGRAIWDDWQDAPPNHPEINFGGPAANIAVNLSALGMEVRLATVFGSDERSDIYKSYLISRGVDVSASSKILGELPRCQIWLGSSQYRWANNNDGLKALEKVEVMTSNRSVDALVFADFPLASVENRGMPTRLFWSPQLTLSPRGGVQPGLKFSWNCVFLNKKEAGNFGDEEISRLAQTRNENWFVTNGVEPTRLSSIGGTSIFPVCKALPYVNAIGGGDAFAAGVIAGLLRGLEMKTAIAVGHAAAAVVVSELGSQSRRLSWEICHQFASEIHTEK
jgi:sugar/nucleoside kinase (ribokinase family)